MRVLFTIPHYVRPGKESDTGRSYGSNSADSAPRVRALTACLTNLHQLFNSTPCFIHHDKRAAEKVEQSTSSSIDVVICTTDGRHVLDQLPVLPCYYTHRATNSDPLLLGFACHEILRERLGRYDFYCYLEDDLIIHDPWFFHKLSWFNRLAGNDKILQPNRFEAGLNHLVPKVYVDGNLDPGITAVFQNVNDSGPLVEEVMGMRVQFQRTLNPHSGCFFLTARQLEHWVRQAHFNDRDSRFIGPLETTASLGIMRAFRVYRPCPTNAAFLEIQHAGTGYLEQLCPESKGESR